MKVFPVADGRFFLRLANGEEVKETLCRFADEHKIGAGVLRGLQPSLLRVHPRQSQRLTRRR
jgi:predicted DNA-binding protein with PD1-like motif